MSTKVDAWNVTYKKGHIVFRRSLYFKLRFDMSDLPECPAEKHDEVMRRLQDAPDPNEPSQKYFEDVSFGWLGRLASAVIKEAE